MKTEKQEIRYRDRLSALALKSGMFALACGIPLFGTYIKLASQTEHDSQRAIAAAQAKRERRQARNLEHKLMNGWSTKETRYLR